MKKTNVFITATLMATFGFAMFAYQPATTNAQPARNKRAVPAPTPPRNAVRRNPHKPKWYPNEIEGETERTKHPRRRRQN